MNSLGKFQMDVGSTTVNNGKYIFVDGKTSLDESYNSDYSDNDDEGFIIDYVYQKSSNNEFDLDSIMVSAIHSGCNQGVKTKHLSNALRFFVYCRINLSNLRLRIPFYYYF